MELQAGLLDWLGFFGGAFRLTMTAAERQETKTIITRPTKKQQHRFRSKTHERLNTHRKKHM